MRKASPDKKRDILDVAARLFATRPMHEVRIDDVAAEAKISKGTVYLYFKSKEELYAATIRHGFAAIAADLEQELESASGSAADFLARIIRSLTDFAVANPEIFRLVASGRVSLLTEDARETRRRFLKITEAVIRRGVARGEFSDPHPELTAQFAGSMVSEVMKWAEGPVNPTVLSNQITRVLVHGLRRREA